MIGRSVGAMICMATRGWPFSGPWRDPATEGGGRRPRAPILRLPDVESQDFATEACLGVGGLGQADFFTDSLDR